jgi:hypothetical protein
MGALPVPPFESPGHETGPVVCTSTAHAIKTPVSLIVFIVLIRYVSSALTRDEMSNQHA